jgi:hypothetical protein
LFVLAKAKPTNSRSIKPRVALLTIVSLSDSPVRVKRFYERGVRREKTKKWAVWDGDRDGLCFPYAED